MTTATNGSSYFLAIWTGKWSSAFLYSLFFTYKFINNTILHPDWWYCIVHTFHNAWMVLSTITDVRFPEKLKKKCFYHSAAHSNFYFLQTPMPSNYLIPQKPKTKQKNSGHCSVLYLSRVFFNTITTSGDKETE